MNAGRLLLILLAALMLRADLASIRAEPNLEKRSQMALDHAEAELAIAKKAYDEGKIPDFELAVEEIGKLAEMSYESLDDTGKRARRSPKWFKKAEQRMLVLLRKLGNFEKAVSIEDRAPVTAMRKRVSDVHDRVLNDIMTKK